MEEYTINDTVYIAINDRAYADDIVVSSEVTGLAKLYRVYSEVNSMLIVKEDNGEPKCISEYKVLRPIRKLEIKNDKYMHKKPILCRDNINKYGKLEQRLEFGRAGRGKSMHSNKIRIVRRTREH